MLESGADDLTGYFGEEGKYILKATARLITYFTSSLTFLPSYLGSYLDKKQLSSSSYLGFYFPLGYYDPFRLTLPVAGGDRRHLFTLSLHHPRFPLSVCKQPRFIDQSNN